MIRSLYLAGSSAELNRAANNMDRVRTLGITVTSTWVESVIAYGANPLDATQEQRMGWARKCRQEIDAADTVWLQLPKADRSEGLYWEFGYAWAKGKRLISSGPRSASIFSSLVEWHREDYEALARITSLMEIDPEVVPFRNWRDGRG